jgi:predicted TIM-barrel fold metal-dependent hydrolase
MLSLLRDFVDYRHTVPITLLCFVMGLLLPRFAQDKLVPAVDHHQHLFNPTLGDTPGVVVARDLISQLDQAGIRRAALFSIAYQFSNPNRPVWPNEYAEVRGENDRVSREVALFPDRLRGFCGVNPLKDYALEEIARCAKLPQMRYGLKLHFGNSDVDLLNPAHLARLRELFRAANDARMAIVVHLRSTINRQRPYGAEQVRSFISNVLPSAPDIPVQIAHLAGGGGYDDPLVDQAIGAFVDAVDAHDPRLAHVYFEVSGVAGLGQYAQQAGLVARRIRQLGVERVLYGTDGTRPGRSVREAWEVFLKLPLTDAEFRTIAANVAPYMR